MATAGSVAGCYVLYRIAERGGEAFLAKRLKRGTSSARSRSTAERGVLALMVPAVLPPPAPFKLFVLLAGVAEVRPLAIRDGQSPSRAAYATLSSVRCRSGTEKPRSR